MKTLVSAAFCFLFILCGCTEKQRRPDAVRENTAAATAALKRDAKAVAQGVREGWTRDNPVNINTATAEQLQALPGVTPKTAASIVAHRPYSSTSELVTRHVLSKPTYDKIADRLKVKD